MCDIEDEKMISDSDREHRISELLQELSDCREDERNSSNQILSVIGAAAAILGVLLSGSLFFLDQEISQEMDAILVQTVLRYGALLNCIVFCTAVSYTITLGTAAVLRYHYIRNLEDRLYILIPECQDDKRLFPNDQENTFVHWFSFSGALVTRNIKHLEGTTHGVIYYWAYTVAVIGTVLFCILTTLSQFFLIPNRTGYDLLFLIIPLLVLFAGLVAFVSCSFVGSGPESKKLFEIARKRRKERLKSADPLTQKRVGWYLIYPKLKDPQKPGLIVIGYFMYMIGLTDYGSVVEMIASIQSEWKTLALFVFIFDFLLYQARYQINDLLGLAADIKSGKETIPGMLKASDGVRKDLAKKSFMVAFARIFLAVILILLVPFCNKFWFVLCGIILLTATMGYEYLRAKTGTVNTRGFRITFGIFALVGVGYPLRFWVGALAVHGFTFSPAFFFTLLALEFYGWFVAILPWKRQIVQITHLYSADRNMDCIDKLYKLHYQVMYRAYKPKEKSKQPLSKVQAFLVRHADKIALAGSVWFLLCAKYQEENIPWQWKSAIYNGILLIFIIISYVILWALTQPGKSPWKIIQEKYSAFLEQLVEKCMAGISSDDKKSNVEKANKGEEDGRN